MPITVNSRISWGTAPVAPTQTLIDPATTTGVQPVGLTGMTLSFSDEFRNQQLNTWKWIPWYPDTSFWNTTQSGGHLTNTDEPQAYDPSAISFTSDTMVFTMRNESIVPGLPYTSGMVCSYPQFGQQYGVFEARMKLSNIAGSWSAFWMDMVNQTWPPEIDIMENWGAPSFNTSVSQGYIQPVVGNNATMQTVPGMTDGADLGNTWHTYSCEWRAGFINWYIDGQNLKSFTGTTPDGPMYLICNLAGNHLSSGLQPAVSDLPFSIEVDYIRAWL